MIRLPFFTVRVEWRKLRRDHHDGPHPMTSDGGCACQCKHCVSCVNDFRRCICPRCNQICPGIGRLGSLLPGETMDDGFQPASRWWWSR